MFDTYTNGAWVDGDTGWITITPLNGWTHSGAPAQYRRKSGEVRCRGNLVNNTATGDSHAFTFDVGFRPNVGDALYFPIASQSSFPMNAKVDSDGTAILWSSAASVARRGMTAIRFDTD